MLLNFYIYYRVESSVAGALEARIGEMQTALQHRTGIAGRLLKKRDEPLLWMEVYENVAEPENFEEALKHFVEQYRIQKFLEPGSQRHVECFHM